MDSPKCMGCICRSSCVRLEFDTSSSSSIVSEWGLVCDENWRSKATMSGFMAGVMLGEIYGLGYAR